MQANVEFWVVAGGDGGVDARLNGVGFPQTANPQFPHDPGVFCGFDLSSRLSRTGPDCRMRALRFCWGLARCFCCG